jgi:hypothetical protein
VLLLMLLATGIVGLVMVTAPAVTVETGMAVAMSTSRCAAT